MQTSIPSQDMLSHAERIAFRFPAVLSVGYGEKEVRGELTNLPAWRIYVREKVSPDKLQPWEQIPEEIAGIQTDVLPISQAAPVSTGRNSRLLTGASLSNLKGVLCAEGRQEAGSGLGVLGFIGIRRQGASSQELALVSNRHVLFANGGSLGDQIYQPEYIQQENRYIFNRNRMNPIAEICDEGIEGNYSYNYPGEPLKPYFIDCAAARLHGQRGFHQPAAGSGRRLFKSIARIHPFDIFPGRQLRVEKLRPPGEKIVGRVIDVMAPAIAPDQSIRRNNILIRAETPDGHFANDGDSGALILDELNRAVGMLWGRSLRAKNEAFACHLHPVLHRLAMTPLAYDLQFQFENGDVL